MRSKEEVCHQRAFLLAGYAHETAHENIFVGERSGG
jgi:hypothetical protein